MIAVCCEKNGKISGCFECLISVCSSRFNLASRWVFSKHWPVEFTAQTGRRTNRFSRWYVIKKSICKILPKRFFNKISDEYDIEGAQIFNHVAFWTLGASVFQRLFKDHLYALVCVGAWFVTFKALSIKVCIHSLFIVMRVWLITLWTPFLHSLCPKQTLRLDSAFSGADFPTSFASIISPSITVRVVSLSLIALLSLMLWSGRYYWCNIGHFFALSWHAPWHADVPLHAQLHANIKVTEKAA